MDLTALKAKTHTTSSLKELFFGYVIKFTSLMFI